MADNNKISIDIEINAEGQRQLDQYKNAFDGLRTSINNLSNPISKLDSDISKLNESLNKTGAQNNIVSDTIDKISKASDQAQGVIKFFASALKIVKGAAISLEGALTGGLTVLIAFAPEIIKWMGEMIKGNTTLSALNKTLKDNKIIMDSVNQVKLQGAQATQREITDLNVLYRATQDHNLSQKQRKEAADALKQQWPDTFKNITTEAIVAGKAADAYKNLKEQIIATAYAEAAKNKITENAIRVLGNDQKILDEQAKNLKIVKNEQDLNKEYEKYLKEPITDGGAGIAYYQARLDVIKKARDASDKIIYSLTTDTNLLTAQNDKLATQIENNINKFDISITGARSINTLGKSNKANIIAPKKAEAPKDEPRQAAMLLEAKTISFAQTIELEKQNYDKEKAVLDEQLNNKLISQQDYQEQSQQLQEKYHQNIGVKVKNFNKIDFASAQKHLQDVVDQEEQKQLLIDETAKKHAQERKDFEVQTAQQVSNAAFSILQNNIKSQSDAKIKQLETQKNAELNNSSLTTAQKKAIEDKYKKKEAEEKIKAFKAEQRASILQAVINGALAITKVTAQAGMISPFIIPGIIAETAIQVATIASQKAPQYAKGGVHYQSDGKGALLPGYSRTDNTNAYLRSGEAVVVSEAMRDPWARNLVSAINVAYGGRDFSMSNPGHGYAIGGIFTDGGNSNRYYNQPLNDQKDLANTIAYQMINNFPPVYVDVKDINNQQNILAQTVNRVTL